MGGKVGVGRGQAVAPLTWEGPGACGRCQDVAQVSPVGTGVVPPSLLFYKKGLLSGGAPNMGVGENDPGSVRGARREKALGKTAPGEGRIQEAPFQGGWGQEDQAYTGHN